jgi:hypothetical protein
MNSVKKIFYVNIIQKSDYKEWLLYKHYAKTIPSVIYAFGLFNFDNILQGVCCYGTPANNHNNNLGKFKCIELVRLVVNDGLPKNTLSFFVTQTFTKLEKPLVLISYADQGKSHCGYIYQATNWIYTGLGGGVDFYRDVNGKEIHSRIMSDLRLKQPNKKRAEIAKELNWDLVEGTYKHRYFYFLGNKIEKKKMMQALLEKYEIKPYPKENNLRYDTSYEPVIQKRLL